MCFGSSTDHNLDYQPHEVTKLNFYAVRNVLPTLAAPAAALFEWPALVRDLS